MNAAIFTDAERAQLAAMNAAQRLHWLSETVGIPELTATPDDGDQDDLFETEAAAQEHWDWERRGLFMGNRRHVAMFLRDGLKKPVAEAATLVMHRLGDNQDGWLRSVSQWCDLTGCSEEAITEARDYLIRKKYVKSRRAPGGRYRLYANRHMLTAALWRYRIATNDMPQGFAGQNPGKPVSGFGPVDNFETAAGRTGKTGVLEPGKTGFSIGVNESCNSPSVNPPLPPTPAVQDGSREPGEDDEETGTSNPPATASRDADRDAVTDVLIRACDTKGIPHKPGEIAAFVTLRDVTPAEAAHAAGVIRNATDPIDRLNYVKSVIENYRAQGRKRDFATPVGGHADPAQTRRVLADLDRARQRRLPEDEQQRHMDEMRAVLRPHCKALAKGNE
jgi:hypothetical protein